MDKGKTSRGDVKGDLNQLQIPRTVRRRLDDIVPALHCAIEAAAYHLSEESSPGSQLIAFDLRAQFWRFYRTMQSHGLLDLTDVRS